METIPMKPNQLLSALLAMSLLTFSPSNAFLGLGRWSFSTFKQRLRGIYTLSIFKKNKPSREVQAILDGAEASVKLQREFAKNPAAFIAMLVAKEVAPLKQELETQKKLQAEQKTNFDTQIKALEEKLIKELEQKLKSSADNFSETIKAINATLATLADNIKQQETRITGISSEQVSQLNKITETLKTYSELCRQQKDNIDKQLIEIRANTNNLQTKQDALKENDIKTLSTNLKENVAAVKAIVNELNILKSGLHTTDNANKAVKSILSQIEKKLNNLERNFDLTKIQSREVEPSKSVEKVLKESLMINNKQILKRTETRPAGNYRAIQLADERSPEIPELKTLDQLNISSPRFNRNSRMSYNAVYSRRFPPCPWAIVNHPNGIFVPGQPMPVNIPMQIILRPDSTALNQENKSEKLPEYYDPPSLYD